MWIQAAREWNAKGFVLNAPTSSPYRQQLIRLLQPLSPISGAEIGVYNGATSYWLLKEFPCLTLWMIDPWCEHPIDSAYYASGDPVARHSADKMDAVRFQAMCYTNFAAGRRQVRRRTSVEAADEFTNESLDFCFIDAQHHYDAVLQDWTSWWPKVRSGGILCGHDVGNFNSRATEDVQAAVEDFAKSVGLTLEIGEGFVGWVQKP